MGLKTLFPLAQDNLQYSGNILPSTVYSSTPILQRWVMPRCFLDHSEYTETNLVCTIGIESVQGWEAGKLGHGAQGWEAGKIMSTSE